jgi:conjugal transfer mating pair stabilization protein TraG
LRYRTLMLAMAVAAVALNLFVLAQPVQDSIYDRTEREPDGSVSVGKYLFVQKALAGLERRLHVSGGEKFSPELQERLMREVLAMSGLEDFKAGKISAEQFQHNLAVHLGSVPDPATGVSLYGRSKFMSAAEVQATIARMKSGLP